MNLTDHLAKQFPHLSQEDREGIHDEIHDTLERYLNYLIRLAEEDERTGNVYYKIGDKKEEAFYRQQFLDKVNTPD